MQFQQNLRPSGKVKSLTTNERKLSERYKYILLPFEQATCKLSGALYPTMSMKISALEGLHEQLQHFINTPANKGTGVTIATLTAINKRFEKYHLVYPDTMCTFVDPRYK